MGRRGSQHLPPHFMGGEPRSPVGAGRGWGRGLAMRARVDLGRGCRAGRPRVDTGFPPGTALGTVFGNESTDAIYISIFFVLNDL